MKKPSNLRLYFIIYFIAKVIVDVAFGSHITSDATKYLNISPAVFYGFAIIINLFLFLIGLSLFYFLLEKRNWARIVLIVLGWLVVLDVVSSLVFSSNISEILTHIDRTTDWNRLILIDRVTDLVGLVFLGFAIYILQFSSDVKKIFLPERCGELV